MSEKIYDINFIPEARGLINMGSNCWLNSLLQVLLGLPALNKMALESISDPNNQSQFLSKYANFVKTALSSQPNTIEILNDPNIRRSFSGGQQCADEALTIFIDSFNSPRINELITNAYLVTTYCGSCKKGTSIVVDKATRVDMFDQQTINLSNFNKWLYNHDSICENYKCDCGAVTNARRNEQLVRIGDIIFVLFNKFGPKYGQIKTKIDYPVSLWFPGVAPKNSGQKYIKCDYHLTGAICHAGTIQGGHYWSYSLRPKIQRGQQKKEPIWMRLNDSSVQEAEISPSDISNIFMLAYHKV
jgi:ubiquitin C-terminal hydrolase